MASSAGSNLLVINGLPCQPQDVPSVTTLLQSRDGAYTTTRTHSSLSNILFWDRHLQRLADSARLLAQYKPAWFSSQTTRTALLSTSSSYWDSEIRPLIASSLRAGFQTAFEARAGGGETANAEEELAITTLICGYGGPSDGLDVFVHFGIYAPPMFGRKKNGARLAVIGLGRDLAMAKLSEWVRKRKSLENLRPPLATELLLSNDGEKILEGSVTNFFVVCQREMDPSMVNQNDRQKAYAFEVQTAPLSDGILPGVVRQLVIEICSNKGIPIREVTPLWSNRHNWKEAFITNSLRLVQHVQMIQAPDSWKDFQGKTCKEVSWEEKHFKEPGPITIEIQKQVMERAKGEGFPVTNFL